MYTPGVVFEISGIVTANELRKLFQSRKLALTCVKKLYIILINRSFLNLQPFLNLNPTNPSLEILYEEHEYKVLAH